MNWYQLSLSSLYKELKTTSHGLSSKEALLRLETHGKNMIKEKENNPAWKIFLSQFTSALVLILLAATVVSAIIGEITDASIILAVVVLNAVFGFIQEYKADKAIESLKKMAGLKSKVLRDGKEHLIDSSELTIGDIILLDTGDKIPADARIIEAVNLEIQESILTGESLSVAKHTQVLEKVGALGDIKNMVFSGTIVTKGRGKAVVCAIGMDTEIGKIAEMMQETPDKKTNLEKKLNGLSKGLGIATVFICIIIFLTYFFVRDIEIHEAFLIAVALAVAAIPEGLPAVVTISLGLGVKRFVKKNVLVRRLSSVETLGSVNVICTDKTGTLTKNEMTVTKLFVNNHIVDVTGTGYKIEGDFSHNPDDFMTLLEIGILCNNSKLEGEMIIGDPTEGALIVSALKGGIDHQNLLKTHEWNGENPFDSERKMMSALYMRQNQQIIFTKGAIENLLPKCNQILINGKLEPLDHKEKEKILHIAGEFSAQALRVLGFAYGYGNEEQQLIFVGLQAMIDPPRDEVKDAMQRCATAGIRVIMITGDNLITAKAIATELGIKGEAMTGEEFEKAPNKEQLLQSIGIFARVNPAHKQTIVKILQSQGNVVAMTGDGVNDAPALKMADIGIGMGITGTDVTKEAADMILIDDNFTSIVNAVQEGRGIYDNIQKFVNYLLASNIGEILILFVASLAGLPLPLLAIHLLWINLVTDGLPAIALGIDPVNPDVMKHHPRKSSESIVSQKMMINIAILSSIMTIAALFLFFRHHDTDIVQARSGVFVLLVFIELIKIQIIRSQYGLGILSNKRLLLAVSVSMALVLAVVYIPGVNTLFELTPLSMDIWMDIGVAIGVLIIVGIVLSKFMRKISR
ncbi:hypothetical protein P148_SR1C00001G0199 [candidate division SR1 bacterium RAAC1_SR1_1]|nr:hypothetical protein P148_SR1C00001G0199 [candidate division SR1 bacterium RAAC1_SR1_1]